MDESLEPTDKHVIEVAWWEIEHEDVFHLKQLYKLIYEQFGLFGFKSIENDKFIETLYWQRILGNGNMEHHIWWRAQNIPADSPYCKYFWKLDYQTLNMGKHEINHNGVKIKTNKGNVILRFKAFLILDYKKEWRNHWLLKLFEPYFIKRIYKNQIDFFKTDLWVKSYKLQDIIKQYMQLKTLSAMRKPFHDELGL